MISVNTKEETPLILAIWTVCYIQNEQIKEYCFRFLHPIQNRLFSGICKILEQIKSEQINDYQQFTKDMLLYSKKYSVVSQMSTGELIPTKVEKLSLEDKNYLIECLKAEKEELYKIHRINEEIWSIDQDIKEMENIHRLLTGTKIRNEKFEKIKEIKEELEKFTSEQEDNLKASITELKNKTVEIINDLYRQDNDKVVERCENIVNKFYDYVTQKAKVSSLNWPIFRTSREINEDESENIKIKNTFKILKNILEIIKN